MDIKEPCNEVNQELARELLIGISYTLPDNVMNLVDVPEIFKSADGAVMINGDGAEKYRSELISISNAESPDIKKVPVALGNPEG